MSEPLLPCPFCGQEKPMLFVSLKDTWSIKCVKGCSIAIHDYVSKEKAIAAWNRRPSTKQYIKTFLAALADLANTWNEPADEEHGWGNDPVVLVVYEDESGFVGDGKGVHKIKGINFAEMEHITIQGEFDNIEQAFEYFDLWLPDEKKLGVSSI